MKRKVFSCMLFAALMGAGMISTTSCADYSDDINAVQQGVNQNTTLIQALQNQINGLQGEVGNLKDALKQMTSCTCGNVSEEVAQQIAEALGKAGYATPEDVTKAIDDAIKGLKLGLDNNEVQALIDAYHTQHPNCSCGDIQTLIEGYLKDHPGLSEERVGEIIEDYHKQHPASTLTESDVQRIVETYVNTLQHLTKEDVEDIIATAISEALANYTSCKCEVTTDEQVSKIAADAIAKYMEEHPYTLDEESVKRIVNTTIENSLIIGGLQTSINTINGTLETVTDDIEDLKKLKDNILTENQIRTIINNLIIQALYGDKDTTTDAVLSPELSGAVKTVIDDAIATFIKQNPGCECGFDAEAFGKLVEQVSNNTTAIANIVIPDVSGFVTKSELETAIGEVKDLIPTLPDLSGYVTIATYTHDIEELNTAITTATANANEALRIARENAETLGGLQTTVGGLQTTVGGLQTTIGTLEHTVETLNSNYITLNTNVQTALTNASNALTLAQSNNTAISTLQGTYTELAEKLGKLHNYDDSELRRRIEDLESQAKTYATKLEVKQARDYADELFVKAKSYAEQAASTAANTAYENAKSYTDQKIGELESAYKLADEKLYKEKIKPLETEISTITGRLKTIEEDIKNLKDVSNYVKRLITGIELQGTRNPAFGYFALPVGVTSNVLIAYYGNNEHVTYFPGVDTWDLVYAEEGNILTEEDYERLGITPEKIDGGTTFLGEEGNAGKLYLTVNPSSVDFTNTEFSLVNSVGEESPVTLSPLKPSTERLTFGQTRATSVASTSSNGFYEADATVSLDNLDRTKFEINDQLTNCLEDLYSKKFGANLSNLAQAIYNQFNGTLDAYAVQAKFKDANGNMSTVTSRYNIAATAFKPLSYEALKGHSFALPTFTPLTDKNINLRDFVDPSAFNFSVDFSKYIREFSIKVKFGNIGYDKDGIWCDVEVDKETGDAVKGKVYIISADELRDQNIDEATAQLVALVADACGDTWTAQLETEFKKQVLARLPKLIAECDEVLESLNGQLSNAINDILDKAQNKLNSLLGSADKLLDKLNTLTGKLNFWLENPNLRLQSYLFFEGADGFLHPLSTAKGMPTVLTGEGAIEFTASSYTAEILVPAYRKFVAVTNVYNELGEDASNPELLKVLKATNEQNEYFNTIQNGDRYGFVFQPASTDKGLIYEIVYSALDYSGKISQRKYYVKVN